MDDLVIESMREVHIPAVMEIEAAAFKTPWTPEMFQQEVEETYFSRSFVVLEGGGVIGYFVSWFLRDEVHLLNIAVARSHRRRGVARRMLEFLIDLAVGEGYGSITLEVRESNLGAIRLYEEFGFQRVGVRKEYYPEEKEDAVLMTRRLDPSAGGNT